MSNKNLPPHREEANRIMIERTNERLRLIKEGIIPDPLDKMERPKKLRPSVYDDTNPHSDAEERILDLMAPEPQLENLKGIEHTRALANRLVWKKVFKNLVEVVESRPNELEKWEGEKALPTTERQEQLLR